jgi:YD repeat-containing protein
MHERRRSWIVYGPTPARRQSGWTHADVPDRTDRPPDRTSDPVTNGDVLLTSYTYDAAGRTQTVTDPKAVTTKTFYDDLGRRTATVEDYKAGSDYWTVEPLQPKAREADECRITAGTFDAWDIEEHYAEHEFDLVAASVQIAEKGPLLAALLVTRRFRNSVLRQRIVLGTGTRRLDFQTWVDWHEQHKLLKVRFHTLLRSRLATYDIAYGAIERPTTRNNSYERAKFEVPGHEWMDLSQADRGLSLLTDSKYGYEAHGRMMALSLLKGPKYPDPVSDQEEHRFTYSLYPHAGGWRDAQTVREAADLNDPADVVLAEAHGGELPPRHAFVQLDAKGVTLEAVKRAEDSDAMILRLVERHGGEELVALTVDAPLAAAAECDLLEHEEQSLPVEERRRVRLLMRPYEIRTMKFTRAASGVAGLPNTERSSRKQKNS